jgi:DNA polymerase III subunit delta'
VNFNRVIGQEEAKQRLRQLVDEERIPHALMFTGPTGSGKMSLALAFASFLLGERWDGKSVLKSSTAIANAEAMLAKWQHPDLHFSYPTIKPKGAGSDAKITSDDYAKEWRQMLADDTYFSLEQWMILMKAERQQAVIFEAESDRLTRKLNMKSTLNGYKVSVIWLPERMNQTCANKMLKLLEEPPKKTVFLLVSEHPELLLETIRSRVQSFAVPRLENEAIADALTTRRGIETGDAERIARMAMGNWLKATEEIDAGNENKEFFNIFVSLMRFAFKKDVRQLKAWSNTVADFGREKQKRLIAYMMQMVRENFMYNFHDPSLCYMTKDEEEFAKNFAPFINERNVMLLQQQLQQMTRDIGQNANAKIQFFDFALETTIYIRK